MLNQIHSNSVAYSHKTGFKQVMLLPPSFLPWDGQSAPNLVGGVAVGCEGAGDVGVLLRAEWRGLAVVRGDRREEDGGEGNEGNQEVEGHNKQPHKQTLVPTICTNLLQNLHQKLTVAIGLLLVR